MKHRPLRPRALLPKPPALWCAAALLLIIPSPIKAKDAAAAPPADPRFIPMADITVPIVDAGRIRGRIIATLTIDAGSATRAATITATLPMLRAQLVARAYDFAAWQATPLAPVDADRLAATLQGALPRGTRLLIVALRAYDR